MEELIFDYTYFCMRIRQKYATPQAFAKDMGMSYTTLLSRIMGFTSWSVDEAVRAEELLDLTGEDMQMCFFSHPYDMAV